jgi:adenine-specific DNA-methyltransferase
MSDRQQRFIDLLKKIFELDKSDLDFGIYRIMNIRRDKIEKFFKEDLPQKISETLAPFAGADSATIRKRMADIESALGGTEIIAQMGNLVPMAAEYNDLKKKLAEGVDISALESDVYSALYSFFSRYYDDGDFISKRRYKEGVYAIPYEGEEVKLYWANQDQYYIKTSENFKDYTFKTNEADGITVHFRLVDATTEQNNNKESEDKKRTFMLYTETEEHPELRTFEYNAEKKELIIRFVYDIPADKKTKWDEANMRVINAWITSEHPELITELLRNVATKAGEHLSLIGKHLKDILQRTPSTTLSIKIWGISCVVSWTSLSRTRLCILTISTLRQKPA